MKEKGESQDSARRRMAEARVAAGARAAAGARVMEVRVMESRAAAARVAARFMRAALAIAAATTTNTANAAKVTVGKESETRVPMAIMPNHTENLEIVPEKGWLLKSGSSIAPLDDTVLWVKGSESEILHLYHLESAFSSTEFVHVDGALKKPPRAFGLIGGVDYAPFHVTVPAVDLDWTGPGAPKDETVEDTDYVWVTDQTNQTFVVRKPDESKDDMFLWHDLPKLPHLRLFWNKARLDVFTNGCLIKDPPIIIHRKYWESGVNTMDFTVSRNLNHTPDGTILDIRLDRISNNGDKDYQDGKNAIRDGVDPHAQSSGTYDVIKCKTVCIETTTASSFPDDRKRKLLGVGEEVYMQVFPSNIEATWTSTAGTLRDPNTRFVGNRVLFEAPFRGGSVAVAANLTNPDYALPVFFKVIEPMSIVCDRVWGIPIPSGISGAGMNISLRMLPTSVSFHRVQHMEVPLKSNDAFGYFADANRWSASNFKHLDHGLNMTRIGWGGVETGNYAGVDHAAGLKYPPPWEYGSYSWPIPVVWRVDKDDNSVSNALMNHAQEFQIDSAGTVTIRKFGIIAIRGTNDTSTTIIK